MGTPKNKGKNGDGVGYGRPPVEHQFKPGHGGRPKGVRNKFSEAYFKDFYTVWGEEGIAAIREVAKKDPAAFVRIAASLMPKEVEIDATDDAKSFLEWLHERTAGASSGVVSGEQDEPTKQPVHYH